MLGIAASLTIGGTSGAQTRATMIQGPAGKLHVDDGGQGGGIPVVFLHSFAGSTGQWAAQLAHVRKTRRAVALDFRGHGRSEPPRPQDYSVNALAADVAAVVDSLRLGTFVLVGHSMGGAAASAYAGAHPGRVAAMLLVGTPGKSSPENANKIIASMREDYEKVSEGYWKSLLTGAQPEVEAQVRKDLARVPRDASLAMIEAIFAYDPLPALRTYRGLALIVDTQHGEGPEALHNQMPKLARRVIAGTSHWPHMDKPEEFNRILDEFLSSVSGPGK